MGECYLEDDFITCEIEDKKLEKALTVIFDGLKVSWHSPVSPPGILAQFRAPAWRDISCYLAEDEGIIYCSPKGLI